MRVKTIIRKFFVVFTILCVLFASVFSNFPPQNINAQEISKAVIVKCAYDKFGNVRFLTNSSGSKVKQYDYDASGNIRLSSGTSNTSYEFQSQQLDPESALYFLRARYYDPTVGRFITRDPVKGILANPQTLIPSAYAQQVFPQFVTNFTYDSLSRLLTASYPDTANFTFTYDKVDNRSSMIFATATQSATANYNYNNDNQLTGVGSTTFTYDSNGNQMQRVNPVGATGFIYNFEDHLTKYTPPAGSATTYVYDGNNNRLAKVVGSTTTRFVTDVSGELSRTLAETNSSNSITKSYVYGLGLISQGTTGSTSRQYFLEDGQGNVRFLTNNTGGKITSLEYDPFGNFRSALGTGANYLYQGQQKDLESSLYYLRARYYDPLVGRFISRDPVKGSLMNPQTQNPYAYSINNPINLSDPSGEFIPGVVAACAVAARAACADGDCTNEARAVASSAVNGINLAKSLASQQQMGEAGKVIAGPGAKKAFEDASKVAQQYGGQVLDWVKMSSSKYIAPDGTEFETHWVENLVTGARTLFKTKFIE